MRRKGPTKRKMKMKRKEKYEKIYVKNQPKVLIVTTTPNHANPKTNQNIKTKPDPAPALSKLRIPENQ